MKSPETAIKNSRLSSIPMLRSFSVSRTEIFFTAAHPHSTYAVNGKEFGVAAWTYWNEKKAGNSPIRCRLRCYILSCFRPSLSLRSYRRSGEERKTVQQSIKSHFCKISIAQDRFTLEREQLSELAKRTVVYAESEKLYKRSFNSYPMNCGRRLRRLSAHRRNVDLAGNEQQRSWENTDK